MSEHRGLSFAAIAGTRTRLHGRAALTALVLLGSGLAVAPVAPADAATETATGAGQTLDVAANNDHSGTHDFYRLSTTQLRAGLVRVRLHNVGTVTHQVQLFRLHRGVTAGSYLRALLASKGGAALVLADPEGGSGAINPQGRQTTYMNLRAGQYVAMCFLSEGGDGAPHFAHGMFAPFTVRGADERDVPSGRVLGTIKAFTTGNKMGFHMPSVIQGKGLYRFTNTAPMDVHELALLRLAPHKTAADFLAWATHGMTGRPPVTGAFGGGQALSPGGELWVRMNLTAGNYVATCFVPDDAPPHLPHAALGMVQGFRVVN